MNMLNLRLKKIKKLEISLSQNAERDIELDLSPMLNRDEISGRDEELSDIEEFYLTEIEQIHNADLMFNLQRDENIIRQEILITQEKINKRKNTQNFDLK